MPFDLMIQAAVFWLQRCALFSFFCHTCSSYPKGKKEHLITINNILLVVLLILYPLIKSVTWVHCSITGCKLELLH